MSNYYPPVGFHFKVTFTNNTFGEIDTMFQSVSGLSVEMETMDVVEGGENRFKHKLPVSTRYPNLVLKRGMVIDSELLKWFRQSMEEFEFSLLDLTITLLNNTGDPLKTWKITKAYPVKMDVSEFNAQESTMAVETMELTYQYFKVEAGTKNNEPASTSKRPRIF